MPGLGVARDRLQDRGVRRAGMGRVFVHLWIQHCGSSQERYFTPPPRGSGPTSRRALRLASSRGAADNDSFNSCMPPGRERRADSGAPHGLRMGSSPRHRDSRARVYERALSGLGLGAVPPRPARGGTHIVADRSATVRPGRTGAVVVRCRRRRGACPGPRCHTHPAPRTAPPTRHGTRPTDRTRISVKYCKPGLYMC